MRRPTFFRRREVWLPTLWGWLVFLALAAGIVMWAKCCFSFEREN